MFLPNAPDSSWCCFKFTDQKLVKLPVEYTWRNTKEVQGLWYWRCFPAKLMFLVCFRERRLYTIYIYMIKNSKGRCFLAFLGLPGLYLIYTCFRAFAGLWSSILIQPDPICWIYYYYLHRELIQLRYPRHKACPVPYISSAFMKGFNILYDHSLNSASKYCWWTENRFARDMLLQHCNIWDICYRIWHTILLSLRYFNLEPALYKIYLLIRDSIWSNIWDHQDH